MKKKQGGPLQRTGVHMTKEAGEAFKKTVDASTAVLASIGSSTASKTEEAPVDAYSYAAGF